MEELAEDLMTLVQIALLLVGVLAIFFTYVNYRVIVNSHEKEREAMILGNYLLSSDCLTYLNITSLFSEDNLISMKNDPSCLKYPSFFVSVEILNSNPQQIWEFSKDISTFEGSSEINVAVRLNTGEVKQALMAVNV